MECPNCKKELKINNRAYRNLEAYHQGGGSVLVATECCGTGLWLGSKITFSISEYNGSRKEDDWGNEIIPKKV